jgi:hypothetical protein
MENKQSPLPLKTALPQFVRDKRFIYALHQTGWRLGQPVLCNKFHMQVDYDFLNVSEAEAEEAASQILEACNNYYQLKEEVERLREALTFVHNQIQGAGLINANHVITPYEEKLIDSALNPQKA